MSDRTNGPLQLRRLGQALREARNSRRITQAAIAKKLGCSQDTISNIERGMKAPSAKQLATMLDVYAPADEVRADILSCLSEAKDADRAWWDMFQDVFSLKLLRFFAYEDAAQSIASYCGTFIPGMLQTRAYVTAVAEFYHADESREFRQRFVQARLERHRVVSRGEAQIEWVMQESVLYSEVGGREAMQEQLDWLVENASRPNLTIRAIPLTSPVATLAGSSFTIMDFPGTADPTILFTDTPRGGMFEEGGRSVEEERRRFAQIRSAALSAEDTLALLKEKAK